MSNKTRLQANNTNLQALINKANALPDAGSGGSVETVEVSYGGLPEPGLEFWYIDGTMTLRQEMVYTGDTFNMLKGSIFIVLFCMDTSDISGGTLIGDALGGYAVFLATG